MRKPGFSWIRLWALVKKEFIHIIRDPRSLAMAFLMPLILLILFGYAITMDIKTLNLVVYDQDRSAASRQYVEGFPASTYFKVVAAVENYTGARALLDQGRAHLALVIPPHFARDLEQGRTTQVQLLADGSDANTATIAMGYAEGITNRYSTMHLGTKIELAVDNRLRVWYNPELKSRWFIIPGLIAVIMTVITALLTSLTVSREWESGTMEQLIATPVQPIELFLGKMAPYFVIGVLDVLFSVAMGVWVFDVPLRGSFLFLLGVTAMFLVGGLSLGIMVSTIAKSQLVASQLAMVVTFLPAFLLSGFLYSIDSMPRFLQVVTHVVQARYFVEVLKNIFLKASPPSFVAGDLIFLGLFAAVVFAVALGKFRKKLS
ncbi:MAG: ABC transporter permease [Gammaproteobacteria bacterium]|uniref:ABC transporter permease n=1 Tax=Rhodoferax sp. TaxID=50421 RepID=UPI00183C27CA|nr:ABC transporter permease [Rhodoferax sp.]MBU3897648.1 ABC transporter permease [Gammaproteobacteria bacterium]MBA3058274.1 ABC transporter permease [Rhodoferax sp.]MBU3999447.1 ABC transporter permease [Gammaproteobacteria bacterium]MBU4017708.1 ABC transporter permease [Gammaproteobacteria bacterium]MBU4081151.1 ABC transporter permease [Gammaproteobacteria bacterium]